ncbi:MAG TPA: AraC family transcriptional regulator [Candidatus Cybelea sp.]
MIERLNPGQWYGQVERSQIIGGTLLSVVYHDRPRKIGVHEHQLSYFLLPFAGGYRETRDGVTIQYEPFSIAFHPAGFVHSDEILGPERFFAIEFQAEWQDRVGHLFDPAAWRFELQHGEAVWLAVGLLQRFLHDELDDVFEVDAVVSEMLGIALRLVDGDRPQRVWVSDVKRLLREEYANGISLPELGSRIGIHPASLSRGFRLGEGITVGEYLTRVRVQQACRRMIDRDASLADIAAACGFADQSHLTRAFKSVTGSAPGVFRDLVARQSRATESGGL